MKRRNFIKTSGAAALGSFLLSEANASFFKNEIHAVGLQLFTFFNVIDKDVEGTLKKIAAVGYKEIESAFSKKGGYYGMKPKEFSSLVSGLGMSWKSHHVLGAPFKLPPGAKMPAGADGKPITLPPMMNLKDNMQQLIDEAAEGGIKYLVCANTPISTSDEVHASIEVLIKTGEACKKAGLQLAYHNHDAEFKEVDGKVPYQLMLSQLNADEVKMELDLAWAIKGGADPVNLFKQHPGRFVLWHVKDIDSTHEKVLPVGEGTIDFKRIFANAEVAGMKHFFVEHDMPADPYTSITTSYKNIQKLLSA